MGLLIDGVWHDQWYDTKKHKGEFVRENSRFHNWVTEDGRPGPTGKGGFAAEPGRYHLYVSYACPWAHRTLIFRVLKKLQDIVSVSVVHPYMLENGWEYSDRDGATPDDINGFSYHHQLYTAANPQYTGRCTVPVLWDKKNRTIVNNESSEIIRMFNGAFNVLTEDHIDYAIRKHCALKSMPLTSLFTKTLTMVFIAVGLPRHNRPMRGLLTGFSPH